MIVHPLMLQGSEEWFAARRGRPTASRFKDIITAAKAQLSASAVGYARELIAECFCPDWIDFEGNKYTDRGLEMEPKAREAFAKATGAEVIEVGFCTRDDTIVGCSPDGLIVSADGDYVAGLEIKCPIPKTHVEYVAEGVLPDKYKQQVHGGMAVTGLSEWHFWSWFPGLKPFHIVVQRDSYTEKLSAALDEFLVLYGKLREELEPKLKAA